MTFHVHCRVENYSSSNTSKNDFAGHAYLSQLTGFYLCQCSYKASLTIGPDQLSVINSLVFKNKLDQSLSTCVESK